MTILEEHLPNTARPHISYPQHDYELTEQRDALFDRWREHGPVVWADSVMGIGSWIVLSHEGCRRVALDHTSLTRKFLLDPKLAPADDPANRVFQANVLFFSEDPDHARLRDLFRGVLNRQLVIDIKVKVDRFFDNWLPQLNNSDEIDVIYELVYPLCWLVSDFIGIPPESTWRFAAWQAERPNSRHLRIVTYGLLSTIHCRSMHEQMDLMRRIVAYHRQFPRDNIITTLLNKKESGYDVSDDEIAINTQFLGMATFDAMRDLLSGSILALLQHPGEIADLAADESLMPNAIEELIRFVTPDQLLRRITTEKWEVQGISILAGEMVTAVLGAANRDPTVFADPHRLWLRRPNAAQNIAFGVGPFSCIAFHIVKAMLSAALDRIISVLPHWRIGVVGWLDQPQIRSLRYFTVHCDDTGSAP